MGGSGFHRLLGVAVVVLTALAVLAIAGSGAATSEMTTGTIHDSPANLTINPVAASDHHPGETNASYQIFATGENATDQDIARLNYALIRYPAGDVSSCTAFSTSVFGVDRNNDDPGTKTDESLVNNQKESGHTTHEIYVEFYDENDLGGESTYLNREDQIVAYDKDCYVNPSDPGWYQFTGKINGTAEDGSEVTVKVDSHYFYICDCADRSEAVSTLGPPPSGADEPGDAGVSSTGGPATPTATTASQSSDDGGSPTPTAEDAGGAETTTATATATPAATDTATAAPDEGAGGSTTTATATPADTATAGRETASQTATATDSNAARNDGRAAVDPPATPTYANGPGFGPVAALLGMLAVALLARRNV